VTYYPPAATPQFDVNNRLQVFLQFATVMAEL